MMCTDILLPDFVVNMPVSIVSVREVLIKMDAVKYETENVRVRAVVIAPRMVGTDFGSY